MQNQLDIKRQIEEVTAELKGKSPDEKLYWIERRKQMADEHYKKREFTQALNVYLNAIVGFNAEGEDERFVELKSKILCNMSVAAFENKNYK